MMTTPKLPQHFDGISPSFSYPQKTMKKYLVSLFLPPFFAIAQPVPQPHDPKPDDQYNLTAHKVANALEETQSPSNNTISITTEELVNNPQLLARVLDSTVSSGDAEGIEKFLPLYEKTANRDEILVQYAHAILARSKGDYKKAIDHMRQIIAAHPELTPVRLQLAITLMLDQQTIAAEDQFEKVRSTANLPEPISKQIDQYQNYLQSNKQLDINASVRYLNDPNINNAPKNRTYGNWTFPQAENAQGIGYSLSANKDFGIANHFAWRVSSFIDGKSYWNNHKFDDFLWQIATGPVYRDGRKELALTPYFNTRRYGNKPYSQTIGIRAQLNTLLTPRIHTYTALQLGRKNYHNRNWLDGNSAYASSTVLYRRNPQQNFYIGGDLSRETAKDKSDAYRRIGGRIGWGQEWPLGISSDIQLGAAVRHYEGEDLFRIKRIDHEYSADISLWNRAWHLWGLTPRLSWSGYKSDSNHPMYEYDKSQFFLQISKKF